MPNSFYEFLGRSPSTIKGVTVGLLGMIVVSLVYSLHASGMTHPSDSEGYITALMPVSPLIPLFTATLAPIAPQPPCSISAGTLRVSNQTYHPIRVALLPQQQPVRSLNSALESASPTGLTPQVSETFEDSEGSEGTTSTCIPTSSYTPTSSYYGAPLHWDFVPREGYSSGLVLALPDRQVQVQPGDIITAFAQDGSRRYWGPYVVGVTDYPVWNVEAQEWSLVLQAPFLF